MRAWKHRPEPAGLSIVAGGTVAAFVLADPDRQALALVLSYACSFLGTMWLDHARVITSKGIYIRACIWPQLRLAVGRADITTHEDWVQVDSKSHLHRLFLVAPVMGVFVLPAVLGVVYTLPSIEGTGLWLAWAIGATLTLLSTIYWVGYFLDHAQLTYIGRPYGL